MALVSELDIEPMQVIHAMKLFYSQYGTPINKLLLPSLM